MNGGFSSKMAKHGFRVWIGIFGRRNAGKSSLANALTGQQISIVSSVPGTTTDPVKKSMELLPLGPVTIVDTAGVDDVGLLGELRVKKTLEMLDKVDVALIVIDPEMGISEYEELLIEEAKKRCTAVIGVINKVDVHEVPDEVVFELSRRYGIPFVKVSAKTRYGISLLKRQIVAVAPRSDADIPLVADLIAGGQVILFILPDVSDQPRGRLYLGWIRAFREVIDQDAYCLITRYDKLEEALSYLDRPVKLVVVDSQAYLRTKKSLLPRAPRTSFSVLEARLKGELLGLVEGARRLLELRGGRVAFVWGCSVRGNPDDKWASTIKGFLEERGCKVTEHDALPQDLSSYDAIVHCNACKLSRQEVLERQYKVAEAGAFMTTLGLAGCAVAEILHELLDPFPLARMVYEDGLSLKLPLDLLREVKPVCPVNAWKY